MTISKTKSILSENEYIVWDNNKIILINLMKPSGRAENHALL